MGAFAVFGVSRAACWESAKKKTERQEGKGDSARWLGEAEWMDKVRAEAERQFQSNRVGPVSDSFDAPQFAEEFLRRALEHPDQWRDLHIKAHAPSGHKNADTGRETKTWVLLADLDAHMKRREERLTQLGRAA